MEMSDILALVRAGYSRHEIEAMSGPEPAPKPESDPKPEPAHKPESDPKPEPDTKPERDPKPEPDHKPESFTGDTLEELMQQMRGVVEAMQMQARNSAQQPPEETTDDIIANIIRPKGGKGGKK